MPNWNIYRGDREYAKEFGDPLIGVISAPTKHDAERIASREYNMTSGCWAVEQPYEPTKAPERHKTREHGHCLEP